MSDKPSDRAIAHLARIAVSHLDDGANCNITPGLNAALRRLREELDKTNAGYAAAPEGAQAVARVAMTHYSSTGREGMVQWLGADGDLIPVQFGALLYTTPPSLGGEDRAWRAYVDAFVGSAALGELQRRFAAASAAKAGG